MTFKEFMEHHADCFDVVYIYDEDGVPIEGKVNDESEVIEYHSYSSGSCDVTVKNPQTEERNEPMEKSLDLRFIFEEGRLIALVEHPESGESKRFETPLKADDLGKTLPDFCADMMMEVSSWLSLWVDEYAANL